MTDHPDTDLNDPHGEADALRRENEALAAWACLFLDGTGLMHDAWGNTVCRKSIEAEALRRENERLRDDLGKLKDGLHAVCGIAEDAKARAEAAEAALAASRAPDPVANAGSCQPGDLISRAAAIEALVKVTPYKRVRGDAGYSDAMCVRSDGPWQSRKEAQAAITALRAQPDWKAMAERLVDAMKPCLNFIENTESEFGIALECGNKARAALSDLAKMKGE